MRGTKLAVGFLGAVGFLFLAGEGFARVIDVPGEFSTIQAALDASDEGDEIVAAPGTYAERLQFPGHNLVLRSTNPEDPNVVGSTIINPRNTGSVVLLAGSEGATTFLAGFTITNTERKGNPRIQGNGAAVRISRCVISNDQPTGGGRGIVGCRGTIESCLIEGNEGGLGDCSGLIERNVIRDNHGAWDGIGLLRCDGTIMGNLIAHNTPLTGLPDGGGLYGCSGSIENNVILGNSAGWGGGAAGCSGQIAGNYFLRNSVVQNGGALYGCSGRVTNNTFFKNHAGVRGGAIYHLDGYLENCIVWGNESAPGWGPDVIYAPEPKACCIDYWDKDDGSNFNASPKFVDPDNDDVRLRVNSPCIDAGIFVYGLHEDIEGDPRSIDVYATDLHRSNLDVGADEYSGPGPAFDRPPRPENLSPFDGEQDAPTGLWLIGTPFVYGVGNEGFLASEWQVHDSADFVFPVLDRLRLAQQKDRLFLHLSSLPTRSQTLYWRVRHMNSTHLWGEWSLPTSFSVPSYGVLFVPRQFPSIQDAIDAAAEGEEVIVSPGRYMENLVLKGKNLILRSSDPLDPWVVANTIVDGGNRAPVVILDANVTEKSRIAGFTLTNGRAFGIPLPFTLPGEGGGIQGNGSTVTIDHNRITNNSAELPFRVTAIPSAWGGGIAECHGFIAWNRIDHNNIAASYQFMESGGAGLYRCNGTIMGNVVDHNRLDEEGYHFGGGGGGLAECTGSIVNNLIFGNEDSYTSSALYQCTGTVRNNIIWDNRQETPLEATYCCIQGWTGGDEGNFSDDPRLADPENDDFHLLPDSPCIDAGGSVTDVLLDFDGDSRPLFAIDIPRGDGSHFDIGPDEFVPATLAPRQLVGSIVGRIRRPPGLDLNGDGVVDIADWIAFLLAHPN